MIHGAWVTCEIADKKTASDECDLGRVYETVIVYLPALASGTIAVQGAKYKSDTPKNIYTYNPATGYIVQMITTATTGDYFCVLPIGGFQFITFVSSTEQSDGDTISCCGIRS